jgi:hypothetical protein
MSLKNGPIRILAGLGPKSSLAFILALVIGMMIGCKSGGEGSSSGSGGSGAGSGASGGSKSAAGDFEGVINARMTGAEGKAAQIVYYVKSDRVRTETSMGDNPDAQGIMIMDLPSAKMTTLIPKQKMYMTMDLKDMKAGAEPGKDRKFPKITPTGRKETVAGYTCEHYLMGDEQNMDMCIARGLGYFGMSGSGRSGGLTDMMFSEKMKAEAAADPEWNKFLEGGAFPLKMTITDGGKTTMNSEVTSIDRKKLDDSLFTVPADYKEMKLPAGMPQIPSKTGQ